MPEEAQERAPDTTEATERPTTIQQPIPSDAGNASPGPPATSVTSAHPLGAALHMPPGFDFLQPDAFAFALPLPPGSDGLGLPAQGFAMPADGPSMQRGPLDQMPPPSTLAHAYSFLPRQEPLQPQPQLRNDALAGAEQGLRHTQFDMMAGGQMFGLEPLGYSESMSFLPSAAASASASATNDYAQQLQQHTLADATAMDTGEHVPDMGMPDFALVDDALMVWSNLPPAMG